MNELCLNLSAIAGYWNTAHDLRAVLEVAPTLRGSAVVVFEHPETTSAEDRANARRIVEAVNAWPPRSSRFG